MPRYHWIIFSIILVLALVASVFLLNYRSLLTGFKTTLMIQNQDLDTSGPDEDESVPSPVAVLPIDVGQQPSDASALGGYNVLIADRGNNRLLEITPDKKIVWQYRFNLPRLGLGADDAFFTDGGKNIIVNLENYQTIEVIDYQTKKVIWQYGTPGKAGHADGFLNSPDDAYKLPNGDVIVADIKNCRVIEISPDKHIVHQYGQTKVCGDTKSLLNKPNGDTPLPNGHILISNIRSHNLIELDQNWQPVFSMVFPLSYPSDPQLTQAGNILISEYLKPGKILEISKSGVPVWEFTGDNVTKLNKPSLAIELTNGNILANDDYNHRVIVIDKKTKKIVWQYGVTGKPGNGLGQLSVPDGVDIIKRNSSAVNSPVPNLTLHTIGQVTRHASDFVGQNVRVEGYLIKKEAGYLIFSDEATGAISSFDLPIVGLGIDTIKSGPKYVLDGKFVEGGLQSSNKNPYHLELSSSPKLK